MFFICFAFFSVLDADAASLERKDITLECIYSDGGLYTHAANPMSEEGEVSFVTNRTSYNLVGVDNNSSNKGSGTYMIGTMYSTLYPKENRCFEHLFTVTINMKITTDEDGNSKVEFTDDEPYTFYKFGYKLTSKDLGLVKSNGWGWLFDWESRLDSIVYDTINDVADDYSSKYSVLSERYRLTSDAPEPNATIYYKQEVEQVAGKPSYVSILVYDNAVLMKKNDRITRLDGNLVSYYQGITKSGNSLSKEVPTEIWINDPEPEPVSSSSSTLSYKIKHRVFSAANKGGDGVHTQRYTLTDENPDDGSGRGNALCDEILVNTSPYLKTAIKAMQILIPLFLIVLTGFDIGKIVLTGNIEEELPKRKKLIITRFVVAVIFFFLPSFIALFTTWLIDSGAKNVDSIEYIDCLFK